MGAAVARGRRDRPRLQGDAVIKTGGEWVVEALQAEGVRHVFGIPGVHNLAIYDALLRQARITHVLARHEAGAAFMADGYARASGAPALVVGTTGPRATNTPTPLSEACAGSMPVLVYMSIGPQHLVGGEVGAGAEFQALPRRLDSPALTTVMGRGAISERDPLGHAVLPNRRASEAVIKAADVVLAVGCRFAHRSTQGLLLNLSFDPAQTLIHLDLDPTVIGTLFKPQLALVGDAKDGLARLCQGLGPGPAQSSWDHRWRSGFSGAASPRYTAEIAGLIETLRRALPNDAIVVNDQTGINYWMELRFPVLAPRTFLYPVGSATLGYGVPAAIGAKIARPERPVICVVGDGGFMYSVNELATAVKYRLPIVFLVMNDDRFGAIKWVH